MAEEFESAFAVARRFGARHLALTDDAGGFELRVAPGTWRIRVWRISADGDKTYIGGRTLEVEAGKSVDASVALVSSAEPDAD